MEFHISKTIDADIEKATLAIESSLKEQGFGIVTRIDLDKTFKEKLNKDFRPYRILGACNPKIAYEALEIDDKIGTLLPCNLVFADFINRK